VRILGIDPGIANTGLVLVGTSPPCILASKHLTTKAERVGNPFAVLVSRAKRQAEGIVAYATEQRPDLIVCEAFEDFGPYKRWSAQRYACPVLLGMLGLLLPTLEWQSPSAVLKATAQWQHAWKQGWTVYPGDNRLTNDHLRDAARHAFWRANRP